MNKILYIVRGFLICHGFIGDMYDTIWKDLNPNKPYNAPLYWHKYNDGNAKAFFSQTNNYGEIRGHVNNFEYETSKKCVKGVLVKTILIIDIK